MSHELFLAVWNKSIQLKPDTPSHGLVYSKIGLADRNFKSVCFTVCMNDILIKVFWYQKLSLVLIIMALNIMASW